MAEAAATERPDLLSRPGSSQRRAPWLLLSPVLFVILYILYAHARGPFYLGSNSDPDYAYLFNSLNMARGRAPHLVNHPGTPLQVLGAIVIKAAHPLTSSKQIAEAVLRNPESYLQWVSFLLAALYAVSLCLVGVLVWQRTGEWQAAFLLQVAPFLLGDQFRMLARVSAETLMMIVAVLLMGVLFIAARDGPTPRMNWGLGLLAAVGTTAKVSFFPLALVPLCSLANNKQRARFLVWFGAFSAICLLPLHRHRGRLVEFIYGLIVNQKKYGFGDPGVLPPEYLSTLPRLLTQNPWLCLVVGLSWGTALYGSMQWMRKGPMDRRFLLLLAGLALGQTLQMLMVAKYGDWRYLVPALIFCPLNLLLILKLWSTPSSSLRPILSGATVIGLLGIAISLRSHYLQFAEKSRGGMQIAHALQTELKAEPIVFYYGASTMQHALAFGNFWAGGAYNKQLKEMLQSQPPAYGVQGSGGVFVMGEKLTNLRDFGRYHSSFILVGAVWLTQRMFGFLPPNAKTEKLLESGGEVITRVTVPANSP